MKHHPLSTIFREMKLEEYQSLKESIQVNGLIEPITIHEDMILDGRHRFKACTELGIKPKLSKFHVNGVQSAEEFVWAKNFERRHLTVNERVCSAAIYSIKNKQLPLRTVGKGEPARPRDGKRRTIYKASVKFGVGTNSIQKAIAIYHKDLESFNRVFNGDISVNKAYLSLDHRPSKCSPIRSKDNIELTKLDLNVPNCFAAHEEIHAFIKNMNAHGWTLEVRIKEGKIYSNFYGNGFPSLTTCIERVTPEFEFRRSVVTAAVERFKAMT